MLNNLKKKFFIYFLLASGLTTPLAAAFPKPWQIGLQESSSSIMDRIQALHTHLLYIISGVAFLVFILLVVVIFRFHEKRNPHPSKTTHNTFLEIVWTLIPAVILAVVAFPSLKLMFFMDRAQEAEMTVKVIGRQWYWSYEYPEQKIGFDSTMIQDKDLKAGQLRLLDVDNQLVVPVNTTIRILVTAADVIHSWAVPSLGIKQDAIPGRIREIWVKINKEGVYYGQCSELCGMQHGFMPIAVHAVSKEHYKDWIESAKTKFASLDTFFIKGFKENKKV